MSSLLGYRGLGDAGSSHAHRRRARRQELERDNVITYRIRRSSRDWLAIGGRVPGRGVDPVA